MESRKRYERYEAVQVERTSTFCISTRKTLFGLSECCTVAVLVTPAMGQMRTWSYGTHTRTAAGGTSFDMPMIYGIGVGLAFTVSAIVQAVALLSVAIRWRYAGKWRREAQREERALGDGTWMRRRCFDLIVVYSNATFITARSVLYLRHSPHGSDQRHPRLRRCQWNVRRLLLLLPMGLFY